MKYFLTAILLLAVVASCQPKILSGKALENKLVETMSGYLDTTLNPGITFKVKDVSFYPDAPNKIYFCQFNVFMHFGNKDTTGIMTATISNDFSKVVRTQ